MKKVLFIAMAAVAFTFTSCTDKPAAPAPEETPEIELVSVDSLNAVIEAGDTTAIGNLFTEVQSKIEELKNVDPAKAKEYLAAVQAFLKENAEKIKAVVGTGAVASLIDNVTNLPEIELPNVGEAAAEAVEDAKDAVVDAATETVNDAAAKVEEKVDAAKEAVEDAANKAVEDGKAAVKDAAADAVNKVLK